MKLSGKDITDLLKSRFSIDALGQGNVNFKTDMPEIGECKYLECCVRSDDGDHDSSYSVIHFIDHDVHIMISGSYSSDDGCDFNHMSEVTPKEVVKIEYFTVK